MSIPAKIQVRTLLRGLRSFKKRMYEMYNAEMNRHTEIISEPRMKKRLKEDAFLREYLPLA